MSPDFLLKILITNIFFDSTKIFVKSRAIRKILPFSFFGANVQFHCVILIPANSGEKNLICEAFFEFPTK